MQIKLISDTFISPIVTNPVRGAVMEVSEDAGRHLVQAGVAIALKMEDAPVKKSEPITSASLPGQVSEKPIAKRRRGRPRKSSPSVTLGD